MPKKRKSSKSRSKSGHGYRHKQKARQQNPIWLWIILGTAILLGVGYFLLRSQNGLPSEIPIAQAYEKYQQKAFFLDVRDSDEWNQMHIPNSILIPLDELQNRLGELPRDKDIVVVCQSGRRSKEGVTTLQQAGFSRVTCMSGGLQAWKAAGYPVEGSPL